VRRGGGFLQALIRDVVAPQKYRCLSCSERWLDWPWLFRRLGPCSTTFRRARRLLGGAREWSPPGDS